VASAHTLSHAEIRRILERAGYSKEQIADVLSDLPDPVDTVRHEDAFYKRGISLDTLIDRMGGSP
jgi:hypothetical protein